MAAQSCILILKQTGQFSYPTNDLLLLCVGRQHVVDLLLTSADRFEGQSHGPAIREAQLTPECAVIPGMCVHTDQHEFPASRTGVANRLKRLAGKSRLGGRARRQIDVALGYDNDWVRGVAQPLSVPCDPQGTGAWTELRVCQVDLPNSIRRTGLCEPGLWDR